MLIQQDHFVNFSIIFAPNLYFFTTLAITNFKLQFEHQFNYLYFNNKEFFILIFMFKFIIIDNTFIVMLSFYSLNHYHIKDFLILPIILIYRFLNFEIEFIIDFFHLIITDYQLNISILIPIRLFVSFFNLYISIFLWSIWVFNVFPSVYKSLNSKFTYLNYVFKLSTSFFNWFIFFNAKSCRDLN